MRQACALAWTIGALSPVPAAFAGIVILEDSRWVSAEAYIQRGAESDLDGPYRIDRPVFGQSWDVELTARAEITDAWIERRISMETTVTGAAIAVSMGYGSGSSYVGPPPEVRRASSTAFLDILFRLDEGTQMRVSGTTLSSADLRLTDSQGQNIPLSIQGGIIGAGVYRVQGRTGGANGSVGAFVFNFVVIPTPASAGLLTLGLAAVRRRR